MKLKHRPIQNFPDIGGIKDEETKKCLKELADVLLQSMRNIFDDLKAIENVELVSSLPTAESKYRGKLFLVSGSPDALYICVDTGGSAYAFKSISLT